MSINNGVYVLMTESGKGPEYRVTYAHAIDNIYGKFNADLGKYEGNISAIKETFSHAPVFYTLNEALDKAEEISYDYEYLEDGVAVISEFADYGYLFTE